MAGYLTFEISGLQEVMRRLDELEPRVQKRVLRKAVKAEMSETVVPAVLSYVPLGATGKLAQSVRLKQAKRSRKRSGIRFSVSIGKDGFYTGKEFYGAFLNFGWKAGKRTGWNAASRRQIEGRHFMEKAFASCEAKAYQGLEQRLREGVDKVVRELGR